MHSNLCFLLELAEAGSGVLTSSEHRPPPTAEMLPPPPMIERRLLLRSTYQVDIVSIIKLHTLLHTVSCYLHYTSIHTRTVDTVDLRRHRTIRLCRAAGGRFGDVRSRVESVESSLP